MSMGEINRVASGNDSMADYSMASLNNDESMAGVDDSGYRVPTKHNTSSGVAQLMNNANSTPKDGVGAAETTQDSDGNMLDGLKQELGLPSQANPQGTNHSFIKTKELNAQYRVSEVFNEDDEYDSEESEGEAGSSRASGKQRKGSLKKGQRPSLTGTGNAKPMAKLADLAKKANKYTVDDVIEERTTTQESPESNLKAIQQNSDEKSSMLMRSDDSDSKNGSKAFSLKLRQGAASGPEQDIVSSSSSDEEDEDEKNESEGETFKRVVASSSDDSGNDNDQQEEANSKKVSVAAAATATVEVVQKQV